MRKTRRQQVAARSPVVDEDRVDVRTPVAFDTAIAGGVSAENRPVARVRELQVVYQRGSERLTAVNDVELEIARGEILAIVGESGSGKTTLSHVLTGLLMDEPSAPTISGSVELLGVDLLSASKGTRRQMRKKGIGAVFQDPMTSLNPTMTVGRQLDEVSGSSERSIELLAEVGIAGAKHRMSAYPHELSGGQRQRVMFAIAVARSPKLVVADEPTTALDVTIQAQILDLVMKLRDDTGAAVTFVTHDLGVAAQIADRIAVMYAGRLVEIGPAKQVLAHSAHPYTIGLLRSRITMNAARNRPLPTLAGETPVISDGGGGCAFAQRCKFAQQQCYETMPELVPLGGTGVKAACLRLAEIQHERTADDVGKLWPTSDRPAGGGLRLSEAKKGFALGRHGRRRGKPANGKKVHIDVLRSVELEVRQGECLGLVGESGCGKSTLLKVLAGLLKLDDGRYEVPSDAVVRMVFQDARASLIPWLTVGEQVGEGLPRQVSRQERRAATAEALHSVGLHAEIADTKARHLSGGQCQRVALARASVASPSVLLCDEPTSSLDVSLAATVLNLIGRLRRTMGMSVVFVTHDLAAARIVADRIAVMYLGRIVEVGAADAVCAAPGHPYTQALISAVPDLGSVRPEAKGELPDPTQPPSGCAYHPRCIHVIDQCSKVNPQLQSFGDEEDRVGACLRLGE